MKSSSAMVLPKKKLEGMALSGSGATKGNWWTNLYSELLSKAEYPCPELAPGPSQQGFRGKPFKKYSGVGDANFFQTQWEGRLIVNLAGTLAGRTQKHWSPLL